MPESRPAGEFTLENLETAFAAALGGETPNSSRTGFLARVLVLALPMAGQILATLLGVSSVLQFDPEMGPQTSALARLFALAAPVLVLASGLYALPIEALAGQA